MRYFINIFIITFLAALAVQGCANNRSVSLVSDVCTDTLSLCEIHLSEELLAPTRMIAFDGKIVIYQRKGDALFMVIPEPFSGKCYAAGLKGRGPNEFIGVDVQSLSPCGEGFCCIDSGGKIKRISVSDSSLKVVSVSDVNTSGYPQNGIIVSDGYVSANVMNDRSEFVIYNGSGRMAYAGQYPEWTSVDNVQLPFTYMKNMIAHPSGELFAAFYVYFRKFRIYDTDGNIVRDVEVRVPDRFPSYLPDCSDPFLAYASYPSATIESIYALCCNRKISERGAVLPEIHVFGWDGEFKRRIILDRYIDIFAIDDKNDILYGFNADSSETLYYASLRSK